MSGWIRDSAGEHHEIGSGLIVGSGPEANLRIDDGSVAERHCQILPTAGGVLLVDLGTGKRTDVGGAARELHRLDDGDEIKVGKVTLTFFASRTGGAVDAAEATGGRAERILELTASILDLGIDLDRLLDGILDLLIAETGAARGFIVMVNEGGRLEFRAARNIRSEEITTPAYKVSYGIIQEICRGGGPVLVADANQDQRFSDASSVRQLSLRSVLGAPLVWSGRTIGAIYLDDDRAWDRFGEPELEMAAKLGRLLGGAIASSMALEETRRSAANLEKAVQEERRKRGEATRLKSMVGRSPAMQRVYQMVQRFASSGIPVLICGESGTGKELVARAIHELSPKADGPFVAENCAAISPEIIDAELFGHVRGAFTGAVDERPGLFLSANGGTLFLDEVGELEPATQAKLLRVLEVGEVRPVGGEAAITTDVRIVCASNRDLESMVKAGGFRADLRFRLDVARIQLPPLRDRREDIPLLVDQFLSVLSTESGSEARISRSAVKALEGYDWPGNVRELKNELRRAVALSKGSLTVDSLSPRIRDPRPDPIQRIVSSEGALPELLGNIEAELILRALRAENGHRSRAARRLGISRQGLWKKIRAIWGENGPPQGT